MVIVCQHCGDKGFENALSLCEKCGECALHRYCLEVLPNDLSEEVIWFCEDCKPDISKQSIFDEPNSSLSVVSISVEVESPKTDQSNKCMSIFKNNEKGIPELDTKTEVQTYEGPPSSNEPESREKCDKVQMLRRKRRLILEDEEDEDLETSQVSVSNSKASDIVEQMVTPGSVAKSEGQVCGGRPFGNDSQLREKCYNEQKLRKLRKLVREDKEAKPLKTLEQRVVTTCTVAKADAHMCDGRSSSNKSQCMKERGEQQQLKRQQKSAQYSRPKPSNILQRKVIASSMEKTNVQICDGGPSGATPQSREKCDNYQKLTKDGRLVLSNEKAEPMKTSQVAASHHKVWIHDSWRPFSSGQWYRTKCEKYQKFGRPRKSSHVRDPKPLNISQQKTSGTVGKTEVQKRDEMPFCSELWYRGGKFDKYQKLREQRNASQVKMKFQIRDSRPYRSELQHGGKYYEDQTFRKRQRLLLEDEPLETSENDVGDTKLSNVSERNCYLEAQPIIDPIWKGNLTIFDKDLNTFDRLSVAAHLSNLACPKVFEVAKLLPEVISLELSNRSQFWPKSFQNCGPSYDHIALYFFPDNRRDDNVFDSLITSMIDRDFAMRAVLEEAELLVFTSYVLPLHMCIRTTKLRHELIGLQGFGRNIIYGASFGGGNLDV